MNQHFPGLTHGRLKRHKRELSSFNFSGMQQFLRAPNFSKESENISSKKLEYLQNEVKLGFRQNSEVKMSHFEKFLRMPFSDMMSMI